MKHLEAACQEIADSFLNKVNICERGYYWETLQSNPLGKTAMGQNEDLYHGVSGIAYFLMHFGKQQKQAKYGQIAGEALSALYHELIAKGKEPDAYAFYTGRLGTAYSMLLAQELGFLPRGKQMAMDLTKGLSQYAAEPNNIDDLINGNAGIIIGLLRCYELDPNEHWLSPLKSLISHLVSKAWFSETGLFWDRSANIIDGLCGLSHGAAGVAHVFCQLYKLSNREIFLQLALAGLNHERNYFKSDWNNWQDLRKSLMLELDREKAIKHFNESNSNFFHKGIDMNAWCHGAAGIGMQRLNNKDVLQDHYSYLAEEIEACLVKTKQTELEDRERQMQILCHGGAGNAYLFFVAYQQTGDHKYLETAREILSVEVDAKKQRGNYRCGYGTAPEVEDTSLFMGNAGIGLMLLHCIHPNWNEDIMCPNISSKIDLDNYLPSDDEFLNALFVKYNADYTLKNFETINLKSALLCLDKKTAQILQCDASQKSRALNETRALVRGASPSEKLLDQAFELVSNVCPIEQGEDVLLCLSNADGISLLELPPLAEAIVMQLNEGPTKQEELCKQILSLYEVDKDETEAVTQAIKDQLLAMYNAALVKTSEEC